MTPVETPQGPAAMPKTLFEAQWDELNLAIKNLTTCFQNYMELTYEEGGYYRWSNTFQRSFLYADFAINELFIHGNRWCVLAKSEKQETVQAYKITLRNNYIAFTKAIIDRKHDSLSILARANNKFESTNYKISFEVIMKEVSAAEKAMNVFAQLIVKVDSLKTR